MARDVGNSTRHTMVRLLPPSRKVVCMRRARVIVPLVIVAGGLSAQAFAQPISQPLDTEQVLGVVLTTVVADSGVPVRVPDTLPLDITESRIFAEGEGRPKGYIISLAGAPDCGGANACTYGYLSAKTGAKLGARPNARLKGGIRAVFSPLSCGASCSPPSISWRQGGVLYVIGLKAVPGTKRQFIQLANSAISAGPR